MNKVNKLNRLQQKLRRLSSRRHAVDGLEMNTLQTNWNVGGRLYAVDLARTPYVVNNDFENFNIHAEVAKVNALRGIIDYRQAKIKGRGLV